MNAITPIDEIAALAQTRGTLVVPAEAKARIQQLVAAVLEAARAMISGVAVTNDTDHQLMVDELRGAKHNLDRLTELRLAITRPIDSEKGAVMDLFRPAVDGLTRLIDEGKGSCTGYTRRVADEAAARQRELDAQAAREREARAAEARRLLVEAEAAASEQQRIDLVQQSQAAEAEAARTVAPIIQTVASKVAGSHGRRAWTVEVTDPVAVTMAICQRYPDMFGKTVGLQLAGLRAWATLTDGRLDLPGLTVREHESMVLR